MPRRCQQSFGRLSRAALQEARDTTTVQYVLGNKAFAIRARGDANSRACDIPPLTKETGQRGSSDATSPSFVARRESASVAYCDGHGAVLIFPSSHRLTRGPKATQSTIIMLRQFKPH